MIAYAVMKREHPDYGIKDVLRKSKLVKGASAKSPAQARVLNIPIISTPVADAKLILDEGYGILCENSIDGVYLGMKKFLDEGYPKKKFDYQKF